MADLEILFGRRKKDQSLRTTSGYVEQRHLEGLSQEGNIRGDGAVSEDIRCTYF